MKQVRHSTSIFISEVKQEKSAKKKNEQGNICFLINYNFKCKITFKVIRSFVSLVTLCVIFFILDLNDFLALMFFYKIDFSLKKYAICLFLPFFVFFSLACSVFPEKRWHFSPSFFKNMRK